MPRLLPLALAACATALAACGDDASFAETSVAVVQGAPIDGSGDEGFTAPAVAEVVSDSADSATDAAADADPAAAGDAPTDGAVGEGAEGDGTDGDGTDGDGATTDEATADPAGAGEGDEAAASEEEADIPEPDEDGVYHLAFRHLSLEGEDIDNIIDFLLFPEEFAEGEGFEFPDEIQALDGKEITISGYMIPGRIRANRVRDFMLVRDLAGCCFGGAPNPDEWVDVVMVEGADAEYLRYLPITVRGTLTLIGEQDQEGYAVGVYRMKATWAGEAD